MSRVMSEKILLIGDRDRSLAPMIAQALPDARLVAVGSVFDGLSELSSGKFTTVIASAEPIERRPEPAVRALRELAGEARVLLFGSPSLEPINRKMLEFGGDDYLVTPSTPAEIQQVFGAPLLRMGPTAPEGESALSVRPPERMAMLLGLPLAEILIDAMLQHPQDAPSRAIDAINDRIGPTMYLSHGDSGAPAPDVPEGSQLLSHAVRTTLADDTTLHLILPRDEDQAGARHALAQLAALLGKSTTLRNRHRRLLELAMKDDLTGLANGRWFRQHLAQKIHEAHEKYLPVTLLLFDIDNFKKYNDDYGHGVGDEILRQTAALIKKCVRPTDLVARISGDEFAVVFFDPEGPRQPRDPGVAQSPSRVPSSVMAVCDRFRRLVSSPEFSLLGSTGRGQLTISGGLAVFPYDAQTAEGLVDVADKVLMFDAKKAGKNQILLVGE